MWRQCHLKVGMVRKKQLEKLSNYISSLLRLSLWNCSNQVLPEKNKETLPVKNVHIRFWVHKLLKRSILSTTTNNNDCFWCLCSFQLILKPYHYAVFSVNLMAPEWEGTFAAEVIISTQFEHLYLPITLRTAEGSLNADKAIFEKCFPVSMKWHPPLTIIKII